MRLNLSVPNLCLFSCLLITFPHKTFTEGVTAGSTFIHYLYNDEGAILKSCKFNFTSYPDLVSLYPNELHKLQDPIKERLSSLENLYCGFKLTNISSRDPKDFTLFSKYIDPKGATQEKEEKFSVIVKDPPVIKDQIYTVKYGQEKVRIKCDEYLSSRGNAVCTLFYPSGKVATHSTLCDFTIPAVDRNHIGKWKCRMSTVPDMNPMESYIVVELKKIPKIESWYKESDGYGTMGCKCVNYPPLDSSYALKYCNFLRPDGQALAVSPFSGTDRYMALGTNFQKNTCQIQIKLPLLENEKGTWQCDMCLMTGYVNIGHVSPYEKETSVFVELGQNERLSFSVPYAASSCFITSPQGEIVHKGTADSFISGKCTYNLKEVGQNDLGSWNCHFSRDGSIEDEVITLKLIQVNHLKPLKAEIIVNENECLEISFVSNAPISTCSFQDPQGKTYHLSPKSHSSQVQQKIRYGGQGFEHGECGIVIENATKDMEGKWICWISNELKSVVRKSETLVQVTVGNQQTAAVNLPIGLGIAAAVLLVALGGFVLYRSKFEGKGPKLRVSPSMESVSSESPIALRNINSPSRS